MISTIFNFFIIYYIEDLLKVKTNPKIVIGI